MSYSGDNCFIFQTFGLATNILMGGKRKQGISPLTFQNARGEIPLS